MRRLGQISLLLTVALALSGQTRRALVVGNGGYKTVPPVTQSVANARAMAQAFTASKFQVTGVFDLEARPMFDAVNKFIQEIQPGDTAAFYFSGYTVQDTGENYLLDVGFDIDGAAAVADRAFSLTRLVRSLEPKRVATGMIILDPAPSNPAMDKRFPEPGLAAVEIRAANLVLAIANLPGRTVPAVTGRDLSRYTDAWVAATKEPALALDAVLRRVKQNVTQTSGGEQVPSEISTLVNEFIFQPRALSAIEWDRVSTSTDIATLETFRQRFPGDPLAIEAGKRIESLEWDRVKNSTDPNTIRQFLTRFPQHQAAVQWMEKHTASEKTDATTGVLSALARYSKAYSSRDADAVQASRPGLGPDDKKRLEQVFRITKSIRYELTPTSEPVIQGPAATVECRQKLEMRGNEGGKANTLDQPATVKLKRQSDGWVIDTILYHPPAR